MSKQALVFMDTGSAITLVTSRVVNAPKIKVRKVIEGMQESTVAHSTHADRLTLMARSGQESVVVIAHIVDWITELVPQDLS